MSHGPRAAPATGPDGPGWSRRLALLARLAPLTLLASRVSRVSRISLRGRLMLAATLAVGVVVGAVTWLAFLAVRHELVSDVDDQLRREATQLQRFSGRFAAPGVPVPPFVGRFGQSGGYLQLVDTDGQTLDPTDQDVRLPVSADTIRVAAGAGEIFGETTVDGTHIRMLTAPLGGGAAVQVGISLRTVDSELDRLEVAFGGVGLLGLVVAALLHRLMTRAVLAPVARLTGAAERIAATRDLAHRVDPGRIEQDRGDELGRLAGSFNAMLDALSEAVMAQRHLVADASHELRTPLTSLRTNVELLARGTGLAETERAALLARIVAGLEDLTGLVSDIVEVARGEEPAAFVQEFRFDEVVAAEVRRAGRHWPQVRFEEDLTEVLTRGVPDRVGRAVVNLLDNAAKFSPPGAAVAVRLRADGLTVRDHGPGIPVEDLPHVFDRFYRATTARAMPGSGLGLAIVRQVADSHGGRAWLGNAVDGGTVAHLWLPAHGHPDHPGPWQPGPEQARPGAAPPR